MLFRSGPKLPDSQPHLSGLVAAEHHVVAREDILPLLRAPRVPLEGDGTIRGAPPTLSIRGAARSRLRIAAVHSAPVTALQAARELATLEEGDRKSTRLNSSHTDISRMPSSA